MSAAWAVREWHERDLAAAYELLGGNGWSHRLSNAQALSELVAASSRVRVAEGDDRVVGFVRALTDERSNGYVSMLVVDAAWRGRGIGRALVESITAGDEGITWVLRAGRDDAASFFAYLGFTPSRDVMERRRGTPS